MTAGDPLLERWTRAKTMIDEAIDSALKQLPEARVVEAARYIAMGGKRLRGWLLVEIASALGADPRDALDAAVAVELVHASSLALDDIIDEDYVRRGSEAAWVKIGVKKTVMVSNLLIPYAQEIVYKRYGERALERTVAAWLDISRGEVIDAFTKPSDWSPETYMEMIRLKTGALFRLAAELGVIAAGREDLLAEAAELGETLGIVYQVADDLTDSRDPGKVEREPALKMFLIWSGGGREKPLETIKNGLRRAEELASRIAGAGASTLTSLPRFIVSAMLGEAPT